MSRSVTRSKETDACEAAGAEADVTREGTTGDESGRKMAMSMRATWSIEAAEGSAIDEDASAVERCLGGTGAEKAMGVGAHLS